MPLMRRVPNAGAASVPVDDSAAPAVAKPIFSMRRQVPVLFTKIAGRKVPVWHEGKLQIAGGAARLTSDLGGDVDSGTVSQSFLTALDQGEEVLLEGHRLVRATQPSQDELQAATAQQQQAEAATRQFVTPRQAKRPRRQLLEPGALHSAPEHAGLTLPVRTGDAPDRALSSSADLMTLPLRTRGADVGGGGLWSACLREEETSSQNGRASQSVDPTLLFQSCLEEEERGADVSRREAMFER
mmetsp:Transcript_43963/g.104044  ORF Transcript_43963/g.104044 Transcript_43963/m.104044 type:complete len:242 (-) Transcript_43963:399-1124(-)